MATSFVNLWFLCLGKIIQVAFKAINNYLENHHVITMIVFTVIGSILSFITIISIKKCSKRYRKDTEDNSATLKWKYIDPEDLILRKKKKNSSKTTRKDTKHHSKKPAKMNTKRKLSYVDRVIETPL